MNEIVWNIDRLREVAIEQYGYVTTAQAAEANVTRDALAKLAKRGRLERTAFGVYRVPQIPATPYDRFMLAVLWTGAPETVLSHETALDLYDICDINPTTIHLTVSSKRRISREGGEAYSLHKENLKPNQTTWWEGLPIVTLSTAIEQSYKDGTPTYLLRQAIENGVKVGLLIKTDAIRLREIIEGCHGR